MNVSRRRIGRPAVASRCSLLLELSVASDVQRKLIWYRLMTFVTGHVAFIVYRLHFPARKKLPIFFPACLCNRIANMSEGFRPANGIQTLNKSFIFSSSHLSSRYQFVVFSPPFAQCRFESLAQCVCVCVCSLSPVSNRKAVSESTSSACLLFPVSLTTCLCLLLTFLPKDTVIRKEHCRYSFLCEKCGGKRSACEDLVTERMKFM